MVKNQNDMWLALLILKWTPITGIDKSPAELLCNRQFRTSIPLIQHASSLANQVKLRNDDLTKYQIGSKALVPSNLGSCILYDKNPDSAIRPEWSKWTITDFDGPSRKYTINMDSGKNVRRTCRDLRPDGS